MAPLPANRLTQERPFSTIALGFAGSFPILFSKGRGTQSTKGCIAIFICFVIKAIHIEVVSDLTSEAFIAAFCRFTPQRGLCRTIFSDNGTTFKGADTELQCSPRKSLLSWLLKELSGNSSLPEHHISAASRRLQCAASSTTFVESSVEPH